MAKDKPSEPITEEPIAQEQPTPEPLTQEQLMAQLQTALTAGDYKAVATVSRQIDQRVRAGEKAELEAKRAKQDAVAGIVKTMYIPFKESVLTELENQGVLDAVDGMDN